MIWLMSMLAQGAEPVEPADVEATSEAVDEVPLGPDRSTRPSVAIPEILVLDELERHVISDGVEVLLVNVPAVRKVEVSVMVRKGQAELQQGDQLESAMAWLADAATAQHDSSSLSSEEDLYDLDVYSAIRTHYGVLGLTVPREELGRGLDLLAEVVAGPAFPKAEAKRLVTDRELHYFVRGPTQPGSVATALMAYGWFPADHPYGERPDLSLLNQVKSKTLSTLYDDWLAASPITVVVVGDVTWSDVEKPLTTMLKGRGKPGPVGAQLDVDQPTGKRVLAAHMPGQEQVGIQLRMSAPPRGTDASVPAWAGQFILGGHFLSRLNANLREEKGWTYGSRANYTNTSHDGMLSVSVDVAAANTADTVTEIEAELQRLVDEGVTPGELDLAYRRLASNWNATRMTADTANGVYVSSVVNGVTVETLGARRKALSEVTPEDVKAVAAAHWGADQTRLWVLVGDKALLGPQLEELGWTVEWVDPADAILGKVPAATP